MSPLPEGETAPLFVLKDQSGADLRLADLAAKIAVLFFYPRDATPGCTLEAREFSELLPAFKSRDTEIVGISGGTPKQKANFRAKCDLRVTLLSDPDFAVARAFGVYGPKKFMGRTFDGVHRTTFLVRPDGLILRVFENARPGGHAQQVLDAVCEILGGQRL